MNQEQAAATTPRYIGDGVYVSFDGYQIWLSIGSHDSPNKVALEPAVFQALRIYAEGINKAFGVSRF